MRLASLRDLIVCPKVLMPRGCHAPDLRARALCAQMVLTPNVRLLHNAGMTDIEALIQEYGGIRPAARALDMAPSTLMDWKRKGRIPDFVYRCADVVASLKGARSTDA